MTRTQWGLGIVIRPRALGCFTFRRMIKPGRRRPYWLGPLAIFSGCRPCRCSPARVTHQRHARLATCASTCSPPGLRPDCRINRPQSGLPSANPRSPVRFSLVRADVHDPIDDLVSTSMWHDHVMVLIAASHYAAGVVMNRTPLLRFVFPFSVHWPRCAVPGCRALGTIPLRRFLLCR